MVKFFYSAIFLFPVVFSATSKSGDGAHSFCDTRKVPNICGFANFGTGDHSNDRNILECDDCMEEIDLPWEFGFGSGMKYTQLCVAADGYIALGGCRDFNSTSTCGEFSCDLPHDHHFGLDAFWADQNPLRGGNVYYRMADENDEQFEYLSNAFFQFSPSRILVFTFYKMARFAQGSCDYGVNYQVLLGATDNGSTRWVVTYGSTEWITLEPPTIGWNGPDGTHAALDYSSGIECTRNQYHQSTGWTHENSPPAEVTYTFSHEQGPKGATPIYVLETVLRNAGYHDAEEIGRRKRRDLASDMSGQIEEYGCWCPAVASWDAHHGEPVDKIDRVCREWNHCRRCGRMDECAALGADNAYAVNFDGLHYTCSADLDACTKEDCECDLDFAVRVAREIIDDRGEINDENLNVEEEVCPRVVNGPGLNPSGCDRRETREEAEDVEMGELADHYSASKLSETWDKGAE